MNLRKCLVVALLGVGSAVAAQAQLGVYVGYTANRISGITCFALAPVQCANGSAGGAFPASGTGLPQGAQGSVRPSGILFGAYYDFRTVGPVRLGLDLRGGDLHANKSAASSAGGEDAVGFENVLAGVRGSVHTKYTLVAPYAQVSAGYARSNATESFGTQSVGSAISLPRYEDNYLLYEGFVGVDLHIFPVLDLRPVELGVGHMNRLGSGSATDGPGSLGVFTISTGIVLHLPTAQ